MMIIIRWIGWLDGIAVGNRALSDADPVSGEVGVVLRSVFGVREGARMWGDGAHGAGNLVRVSEGGAPLRSNDQQKTGGGPASQPAPSTVTQSPTQSAINLLQITAFRSTFTSEPIQAAEVIMADSVSAKAWLMARGVLLESGAMETASLSLQAQGFSAAEFRAAPSAVVARALTAAEDWLEDRRQSGRVLAWRLRLRSARRLAEGR
jgi:hypothetical protein